MAKKGTLSFIELHLEKAILGLAVLLAAGLGVYYFVLEPNQIQYAGQSLGPDELDEAISRNAAELRRTYANAKPKEEPVPDFASQLKSRFQAGILAPEPNAPPLPGTLPLAVAFGRPLPTVEEGGDSDADVVPVTPLRPTGVVAQTGISVVRKRAATLGDEKSRGGLPDDDDDGPAELSWVTVAAWFSQDAQQREMTKAGYASYRIKPYVVGVEVQRQEMLANGEWGEWLDVEPGKAMPKVDVPTPIYDDKTGDVVNQNELDARLELVKANQQALLQPAFYVQEGGDYWDVPPLPGMEEEAEEAVEEPEVEPEVEEERVRPERPEPSLPPGGAGRGMPPGGGRGRPGGGMYNPFGGGGAPQMSGGATRGDDPKKELREKLAEARKEFGKKNYGEAVRLAQSVSSSGDANRSQKAQAKRIAADAENALRKETERATRTTVSQTALVEHPETEGEVAVWFHDDSVEPGKTYRYRMRVKLWNRYVGRRDALAEQARAAADQTVLAGEWSLPGAPITVAPKQHFFVRGPSFNEPAASVEVFTWHKGKWHKEDFKVHVGEVIGAPVEVKLDGEDGKSKRETIDFSTNAIVLDLRLDEPVLLRRTAGKKGEFAYREAKSLVLVYVDPVDGQVKERVADIDRNDPMYHKLKEEVG